MPYIAFADWTGPALLECISPRFRGYRPDVEVIGPRHVAAGTGVTHQWQHRLDYTVALTIDQLAADDLAFASRLKRHLMLGGRCQVVTDDLDGNVHVAHLRPGTEPAIRGPDPETMWWEFSCELLADPFYLVGEGFEAYTHDTAVVGDPLAWIHCWTQMSEGDPASSATAPVEGFYVRKASALPGGGAFNAGGAFAGRKAMHLVLGYHDDTVVDRSVFIRRTFTGLPASTPVTATVQTAIGYRTGAAPAQASVGMRINGVESYHAIAGRWVPVTLTSATDASGQLTVDLGAWHFGGNAATPPDFQRIMGFDELVISPVAVAQAPALAVYQRDQRARRAITVIPCADTG